MLYANHISPATRSLPVIPAPTHELTRLASAVFTAQPDNITIVVKIGWQSNTTNPKGRSYYSYKDIIELMNLPRRPKPAAMPPSTFRTIHSRSNLSSSRISRASTITGLVKKLLALYCGGSGCWEVPGEADAGRQMVSRERRNNLLREE